ncbi:MAG: hypothetical protein V1923_06345 [Candidatus Omnitrophota bacterium]
MRNKGQALILVYGVILFFLTLTLPLFHKIMGENTLLNRQRLEKEVFYLAEGGMEDAINQFINAIANFQVSPNVTRYPAAGTLVTTYAANVAFPTGAQVNSVINEAESGPRLITDPDGIQVTVKSYVVTSTCQHPANSSITVTLNQAIILRVIFTFQHAVFYNDDLEILPGPNMTFTGRIHGNQNIYLHSDGSTLTINSEYLRSAADIYNRTKDGRGMGGTVRIRKAGTGAYFNMAGLDSDSANWLTESQTRWAGTVKSSVHGVTKLAVPVVGSIQPGGYYANQAEVTVENGNIRVGGTLLIEGTDIPAGTVVIDNDFYDNREASYISMTNIDLKKLAGYAPGDPEGTPSFPNHLPSNGLIFANNTGTAPGIRLVSGSQIYRTGGLTVVTNDPLYIQGDYNTVNKQPTAVICDSVNLLSNSWSDANSASSLSSRTASNTTVNTAFIAGVDNTTTGNYNGGLENYPRLHEGWSGKELTIRGSFVELWETQVADGAWAYGGSRYTAPVRLWYYDTDFGINYMPPFTPWAVEAQRGAWWKS